MRVLLRLSKLRLRSTGDCDFHLVVFFLQAELVLRPLLEEPNYLLLSFDLLVLSLYSV